MNLFKPFGAWVTKSAAKIKSNLGLKVFLQLFAILFLTCTGIVLFLQFYLPIRYTEKIKNELGARAQEFVDKLESGPLTETEMQEYILKFCLRNGTEAELLDKNENSIYKVDMSQSILAEDPVYSGMWTTPFINDNQHYTLDISIDHNKGSEVTEAIKEMYLLVLVVIFVISAVIAVIYSKHIAGPVVEISNIARRMENLDMTWKCKIDRTDEIGVLACSLNNMALQLDRTLKELESANLILKTDMEKERMQSKQRSDFFMSISHELKTPLTILKGETEGMLQKLPPFDNRDKYLLHSMQVIETMEKMIKDILAAARTQMIKDNGIKCSADIGKITEDIIQNQDELARSRNIGIHMALEQDLIVILEQELFSKALANVINNAIVHSAEGSSIYITARRSGPECILTVENINSSIPDDEIRHVFEPFYKVDKSRAGNGTGLGLYIVKSFLEYQGFRYSIANQENSVIFTIIMPLSS